MPVGCNLFTMQAMNEMELRNSDKDPQAHRSFIQTRMDALDLTYKSLESAFRDGYNPFMLAALAKVPLERESAPVGDVDLYAGADHGKGVPPQHIWEFFETGKLDAVLGLIEYLRKTRRELKSGVQEPTIFINQTPWKERANHPNGEKKRSFTQPELASILGSYNFFATHAKEYGFDMPLITQVASGPFKGWQSSLCFIDQGVPIPRLGNYFTDWYSQSDPTNTEKYYKIMDELEIPYKKGT